MDMNTYLYDIYSSIYVIIEIQRMNDIPFTTNFEFLVERTEIIFACVKRL